MTKPTKRASVIVATGTLCSRVLGFVKAIIIAHTLGLIGSQSADAFANANALPTTIYALVAAGVLSAVLVPQIIKHTQVEGSTSDYINKLITLGILSMGSITALLTLFTPWIVSLYTMTVPKQNLELVIIFAYWCMPQIFFYGLYAIISEVLNAKNIFAPFAWAPAVNNIIGIFAFLIFGFVFGTDPLGQRTHADWNQSMATLLALLNTFGSVGQAVVLFAFLKKAGIRYKPNFHFKNMHLRQTSVLAGWSFGLVAVVQIVGWVETLVANLSFGKAASLASLNNAWMIFLLPHSIVAVSLATTMFTSFSASVVARNTAKMQKEFLHGFKLIVFLMSGCSILIWICSPLIASIFTTDRNSIQIFTAILCFIVLGLVPYSALHFVNKVFYAKENTKAIFVLYAKTAPIHILLMLILAVVVPKEFLIMSLVLASSAISWLRFALQIKELKRFLPISQKALLRSVCRGLFVLVPSGVITFILAFLAGVYSIPGWIHGNFFVSLLACLACGICFVIVSFVILTAICKIIDIRKNVVQ